MGEDTELFTAIIFCPVCASNTDAEGVGKQAFKCEQCGTEFVVDIQADIVREYSMV